jgi:hypothetical protein
MMRKNISPPATVTFLSVFVLFITLWNVIRIYSVIANWQVLRDFGANPVYILMVGIFWLLSGIWLFRTLWEGHHHAIIFGLAAAGLYFLWYWCDRLFIQPSPAPNGLFSLITSIILLMLFGIILVLPSSRTFFNKE